MDLARSIALARGDQPADLLLRNLRLVNVLSGEVQLTSIAIADSTVVGLGNSYAAREVVDLEGRYVAPGFIDAHVHVESSMVLPREFGRVLVARGVTTAVTNPHEIANVLGLAGIRFMIEDARLAPLCSFVTAPSCVPASHLATAGARLTAADLEALLREPTVIGLGEVMDFPGVVSGSERILTELEIFRGKVLDGHCPGLTGPKLNAYVVSGIDSDHECTTAEEAREKLRVGMAVFAREATGARNLKALLPLARGPAERRISFCTDDRQPSDLLEEGSIDHLVRLAIAGGVDPIAAIRMATLNPAEHYGLRDRGALCPGRRADLLVFSDLERPQAELVYVGGKLAARGGVPSPSAPATGTDDRATRGTVRVDWPAVSFRILARGRTVRVIGVVPDQITTEAQTAAVRIERGSAVADPGRDLLKMAVVERHRGSGNVGLGFVKGLGLGTGALASTVAHDHHNLVVIGTDDRSMETAARAVADAGGGQAAAVGERLLGLLELPIAGLLSDQPIETVRTRRDRLLGFARELGSPVRDPFSTLSFLALEVVPALKLTDLGLVDVNAFRTVPLFTDA